MTQPEAACVERGPITEVTRFALGMAALLERQGFTVAANELRRLHAENEKFRKHIEGQNDELDKLIPMAERLEAENERLHQINKSHEMKLSVRGYEIQIADLEAQRDALLEALKQIEPILARMYGPQAAELPPMQIVRAAIAKAEGQQ